MLYLDDIILLSRAFNLHMKNLETVFERSEKSDLKLNAKKCQFFRKEVTFFGHTVSQNRIKQKDHATIAKTLYNFIKKSAT